LLTEYNQKMNYHFKIVIPIWTLLYIGLLFNWIRNWIALAIMGIIFIALLISVNFSQPIRI
jgi:hypothetical protein